MAGNKDYKMRWQKDNYYQVSLMIPKSKRMVIKELAQKQGKSINQCIIEAIEAYWGIDLSK